MISKGSSPTLIGLLTSKKCGSLVFIVVSHNTMAVPFSPHLLMGIVLDIGGGSILNNTRHALARIPLRWMVRQCFILHTGILFYKTMFKDIGLDPDTLYPDVLPRPAPVPYTSDCLARKYEDPINFAKNNRVTVKMEDAFINEEEEDLLDALTPIYDQLKLEKGWWILKVLPYMHHFQKEDDTWTHTQRYVQFF